MASTSQELSDSKCIGSTATSPSEDVDSTPPEGIVPQELTLEGRSSPIDMIKGRELVYLCCLSIEDLKLLARINLLHRERALYDPCAS